MTEQVTKTSFNIDNELLEKLRRHAKSQERTLSKQVIFFIKEGLSKFNAKSK